MAFPSLRSLLAHRPSWSSFVALLLRLTVFAKLWDVSVKSLRMCKTGFVDPRLELKIFADN